ncbi:MAG TPA: hypothetical protein VEL11_13455 [Candidatus Bathyarchaeia archaeon]|nr:hypothetical protein [Candidatus Bathyarchaeia archaeon]
MMCAGTTYTPASLEEVLFEGVKGDRDGGHNIKIRYLEKEWILILELRLGRKV